MAAMRLSGFLRNQRGGGAGGTPGGGGGTAPGGGGGGEPEGGAGGAPAVPKTGFELVKFPETGTLWPFAYMH